MSDNSFFKVNDNDKQILRRLGEKLYKISQDPVMKERKKLWYKHASLNGERPMVLAETQGVLDELVPLSMLECQEDWARNLERKLREKVFIYEKVQDDTVIEPYINYNWFVDIGNYGFEEHIERADDFEQMGSYTWEPPIKDIDNDLEKLHFRKLSVDKNKTLAWEDVLHQVFDNIISIRRRGSYWWTMGLSWEAIKLIGLENLMLYMYDNPEGLHRLMSFLRDEHIHFIKWFESEGLLTMNNEDDYIGSGSVGYTHELPYENRHESEPIRLKDLWVLSESQETVGVSPEMFEKFIFKYQLPIINKFGLAYYGCCEGLEKRIHILERITNLRRLSVSPWAKEEKMARFCSDKYIYCRKPNPALISKTFNEDIIRNNVRKTLEITQDCNVEIIMKDVHTLANNPLRLGRWVEIVREEIDNFY